jgi:hypothetical protein
MQETVQFQSGTWRDAERFEAVKVWLTAQGFDVNSVVMDTPVTIEDGKVSVEVYARGEDGRLKNVRETQTRDLVSEPSDLVMGVGR